jgi:hypothetical protein
MALRIASDDDYEALFGMPAPAEWHGLVAASNWLIEGLGCVYRCTEGRWWLGFARSPGVRKTKTAHAGARALLAHADRNGLTLHAIADPAIRGAEMWIARLGFERTDEQRQGLTIWIRRPQPR